MVDFEGTSSYPTFVFNHDPGSDSVWKFVPVRVAPPAASLKGISFLQTGEPLPLLPSALLNGVWLSSKQVEKCIACEGIPFPESGSGAGGRVLKPDLVELLVEKVLSQEPQEVRRKVKQRLGGESAVEVAAEEDMNLSDCPENVLKVLEELDTENKEHFRNVVKTAKKMLEQKAEKTITKKNQKTEQEELLELARQKAEPMAATGEAPPGLTAGRSRPSAPRAHPTFHKQCPEAFHSMLPSLSRGLLYFKWQPNQRRAGCEFPRFLSKHVMIWSVEY